METRPVDAWTVQINRNGGIEFVEAHNASRPGDVIGGLNRVIIFPTSLVSETTVLATNEADARFLAQLIISDSRR